MTIVIREKPLRQVDGEVIRVLLDHMQANGINLVCAESLEVFVDGKSKVLKTSEGEIRSEKIISAVGRVPNIDELNLEEIGVKVERGAVVADDFSATSVPNIFAIGDAINK